jgi:hypothetical protein
MRNTADVTGGKAIAVLLQSISGVSAINPLVAFYDVHGGKREVLFFYFVLDTTRDWQWQHEVWISTYAKSRFKKFLQVGLRVTKGLANRNKIGTRLIISFALLDKTEPKHALKRTWICMFILGLGVSMYNMYLFTKKMYLSKY